MPRRVAFIFTHRIQYFTNLLDELQRRGNVQPVAVYARGTATLTDPGFGQQISWDNRQNSSFSEFLLAHSKTQAIGTVSLAATLCQIEPDTIHLNGYANRVQWQAWFWARKHKLPIFLRGDGDTLNPGSPWRSLLRNWPAKVFTHYASHVFFQGQENRKYWLARGTSAHKMSWLPCVSDTTVFHRQMFPNAQARDDFRKAHDAAPHDLVLVVSGKLEHRKRPADALHLLAKLSSTSAPVKVWFLGSGPLENELKALAASLGVAARVHWFGFRNQTGMPSILQAADVLLHLSEADPWPYSVLDGAASGLALLLSDRVGSVPDWLELPPTGLVFPCGNISALSNAVCRLVADRNLLRTLAESAKTRSRRHTEEEFCRRFEQIVQAHPLVPGPKPSARSQMPITKS